MLMPTADFLRFFQFSPPEQIEVTDEWIGGGDMANGKDDLQGVDRIIILESLDAGTKISSSSDTSDAIAGETSIKSNTV